MSIPASCLLEVDRSQNRRSFRLAHHLLYHRGKFDGVDSATSKKRKRGNPLAWMVKEIRELRIADEHLIHHPGKLDGVFDCSCAAYF